MPGAHVLGFTLFNIGTAVLKEAADTFLSELTKWVASGAASLLGALGGVLNSTTTPDLTKGFPSEFAVMSVIGAAVALPLLVLASIRAIIQQDVAELLRVALLRLPAAILLAAAAVELVGLALQASDAMSSSLLAVAGKPVDGFITTLTSGVSAIGTTTSENGVMALSAFGALLLALVAAVVSFVLWLELVVRSAAVAVATLFLPLALAGIVWPATAHWARRLAETLLALILAKVVIAGTLALAGVTLISGAGAGSVVEGIALILLATFAPFSLLRLVPMVENGAMAHLEGLGRRSMRAGFQATSFVGGIGGGPVGGADASGASGDGPGALGISSGGGGPSRGGGGPSVVDDVPHHSGVNNRTRAIASDARDIEATLRPTKEQS